MATLNKPSSETPRRRPVINSESFGSSRRVQLINHDTSTEPATTPAAVDRKNWLFVGSVLAGQRAAALRSLVESCKSNQVEPWAYLKDIFTRLTQILGNFQAPAKSNSPNSCSTGGY